MSDAPVYPPVALVGPTGVGKSALAHELAAELGDVEIATVDSMTVYRGMDLGTAKPSRQERTEVTYHLLDLVDPSEEFTLAQFQRAARVARVEVNNRGHRLLYVGGTGLYGRAVIDDLEIPGQYPQVRAELDARVNNLGALYGELVVRDPLAASRMEPTNERRIVRALEVTLGSGRPFSSYGQGLREYAPTDVVQIGVRRDLAQLDEVLASRFHQWMERGLLDEVRQLSQRTRAMSRTARQAVGYRELLAHLEDGIDLDLAIANAITATRRLARRQRSWFSRDPRVEWFDDAVAARDRLRSVLHASPRSAKLQSR